MQFLNDVFIRCPECNGRRYRPHILQIKVNPGFSIADLLDSTVEDAAEFLAGFPESRPAARAIQGLRLLQEVGLGYLQLGQPINTLSGGESQRLKLVRHLAASNVSASSPEPELSRTSRITHYASRGTHHLSSIATLRKMEVSRTTDHRPSLFLFDEPTTGLHFDDVRIVLKVFQRLVDAGHSVLVIEHNLDVIKSADWVIDLGPEAGDGGGCLVAQGTPEDIALCPDSHTGKALSELLPHKRVGVPPARVFERLNFSQ
jgi:excinuclease ABC subunit A